ncbi:hypothetical protein NPIL_279001 [Nephila pilipes]|uniref:Uncharacterized protein n=1 Tax=Nephila pilipes TaxID=299642 RepID=A0A8X6Q4C3_NEPPI|nr:hypothetical protein NPIL_279001 [Nephila pilipes]
MNKLILSGFIALLAIVIVQSQDNNFCGLFGRVCKYDQYCWRPNPKAKRIEYCVNFRKTGRICNDERLRCAPGLACVKGAGLFFRTCQESPILYLDYYHVVHEEP